MYLIGNTVVSYYFVYWTTSGWNSRIYHSLIFMLFTFMQLKAKHTFRWKIASWKLFFVPPPPLTLLPFCPEMHPGTTWFVLYCWIPTPCAGRRSLVSRLFTFQICMVVYISTANHLFLQYCATAGHCWPTFFFPVSSVSNIRLECFDSLYHRLHLSVYMWGLNIFKIMFYLGANMIFLPPTCRLDLFSLNKLFFARIFRH